MSRVGEQQLRYLLGRGGADDLASEPLPDEAGNEADMVEMGVRQKEVIDPRRIEREWIEVVLLYFPSPLKEPAIEQNTDPTRLDQMARSGYRPRSSAKRYLHPSSF